MKKTLQVLMLRNLFFKITSGLLISLMMHGMVMAQEFSVTGQVKEGINALPGVSILEKGTSRGTTSDSQGKFSLTVTSPSTLLVFSFIGYKTIEVPVANQTTLDVIMEEDITALTEVVVTALGVQKEIKSLGYSVQKVEGKSATKAREPNIINSLTGKVAGLEIRNQTDLFQDPTIRLRGAKPLIVIDGVPNIEGDIWKINADDIESYSILKGATASALYGSIGRNGALMITTKRGLQGAATVEVNSSTMFQPSFIRIPDVQSTYGNGNNGQYAFIDGSGGGPEGGGWIWGPKLDQLDPSTPSGFWETTQYNSPIDPATGELTPLPFLSKGKDNVKNFFRTGIISTNNISVSGGNENSNYRMSVSHTHQKGIVPNSQLNNTSFAVSGGFKITDNFKTDASLTYNRQYTDNFPETGYGPTNYLYNLVLWTGPDVDVRDLENYWLNGKEGIQQRHFNTSWYNNPHFQANEYQRGYYKDNAFGQLNMTYTILKGLDINLRTGINQYTLNRSYKEPKSYVAYDYVSDGNFELLSETQLSINTDFIVQYSKQFSNNFSLHLSAGGANRWRTFRTQYQATDGLKIPDHYNISNSANPLRGSNRIEEEKVNSAYGTLDAEFMSGIFLGITARQDWVSTLPVKNNSFFYPSLSLAGVITDFLDLSSAQISFLKFRGSWSRVSEGKVRLTDIDTYPYRHIQAYESGINWNSNQSLSFPNILVNPDIKTETSDTYEIGADIRFFNGRLNLDAALYRILDFNNIVTVPYSLSSGTRSRLENRGEFLRKGIELTLTGTPIKNDIFSWNVTVNWSKYNRYLNKAYSDSEIYIKEGERMDQIYGFSYSRTSDGKLILQSNGYPQNDPYNRFLGHSDPDFVFGIQNAFTYKNFALNISIDGRVGGVMYSTTNQKMWWGGTHPGTVNQFRDDANNGLATYIANGVVVVEGSVVYDAQGNIIDDTRVFAPNTTPVNYISWNIGTSNAYLNHYYDQSYAKLREVTLTYTIPKKLLTNIFMKSASISLVGRNLALWSDMPEVDPDAKEDNLQTPSSRSVGFNVNFSF